MQSRANSLRIDFVDAPKRFPHRWLCMNGVEKLMAEIYGKVKFDLEGKVWFNGQHVATVSRDQF